MLNEEIIKGLGLIFLIPYLIYGWILGSLFRYDTEISIEYKKRKNN